MTGLALLATAVLIALNAFFVIAEYALIRSRRHRLEALSDEGARGANLALRMLNDLGSYISAAQVGVTADHTAVVRATIQVSSVSQLARVMSRIETLKDVISVQRDLG